MSERRDARIARRLLHRLLAVRGGIVFHLLRTPMYLGTLSRVQAALDLQPGERLLDVGCGTGICASLTAGSYVGVDTAVDYLVFARGRHRASTHAFAAMSATALALASASFDKALVLNLVHHLDADAIAALLASLHRVVRGPVVVVDAALEAANTVERLLLDHDRGDHVRSTAELRAILAGTAYDVESVDVFHNALHLVPQSLFRLSPRR
jgi:ubiquinone/menaquinone biosynthesis C-methylase UbiE